MTDPFAFPSRSGMGTTWAAIIKTKEHRAQSAKLCLRSNLQCASNPIALFFKKKGDVLSCLLLIRIMVRSTYVSIRGDLIFLLYTLTLKAELQVFFSFIRRGIPCCLMGVVRDCSITVWLQLRRQCPSLKLRVERDLPICRTNRSILPLSVGITLIPRRQ